MDVANKLSFIRISLDAATPEVYEKVHGVPYFERVMSNIKELTKYMEPLRTGVGYLIVENNVQDILEAAKIIKQLGCRFLQYRPASLPYEIDSQIWIEAHEKIKEARKYCDENFQIFDAGVKWRHVNGNRYYKKCYTSSLVAVVNLYSPVDLNYPNWHHWTGNNDEQREYGVMMAKKLLEEGNCHVVKWNTINEAVDKIGDLADIL